MVCLQVKSPALKIFQRYHFSSGLKRMAVIAGHSSSAGSLDMSYIGAVKGAPETLKDMFTSVPANYDQVYLAMSRKGARVLALGYRNLGTLSHQAVRSLKRHDVESELKFAGFLILSCPLKKDSMSVIKEIVNASHRVVMITGDNPLTACHVARVLRFSGKSHTLILTPAADGRWLWQSVERHLEMPLVPQHFDAFVAQFDLCLTGTALAHLHANEARFKSKLIFLHFQVVFEWFSNGFQTVYMVFHSFQWF